MTRAEWLKKLRLEIYKLPREEIDDIIAYYTEYFEEAGEDREQMVIAELGSPAKIATQIKADYAVRQLDDKEDKHKGSKQSTASKAWWIILAVVGGACAAPVALPLVIVLVVLVVAMIITIFSVIFSVLAAAIASFVSGLVLVIVGITTLGGSVPAAVLIIGIGLMIMAITASICYATILASKALLVFIGKKLKEARKRKLSKKYENTDQEDLRHYNSQEDMSKEKAEKNLEPDNEKEEKVNLEENIVDSRNSQGGEKHE